MNIEASVEFARQTNDGENDVPASTNLIDLTTKGSTGVWLFDDPRGLIDATFASHKPSHELTAWNIRTLRFMLSTENYDLVHVLLNHDTAGTLLDHEHDILHVAILVECAWVNTFRLETNALIQIVQTLIQHGAPPNERDEKGNTPLYYACTYGHAGIFKSLVAGGADYTTWHPPIIVHGQDATSDIPTEVNLLQIALDSWTNRGNAGWKDRLTEKWGELIMFLLGEGLAISPDYWILARLLHVASYQGNISIIQRLVALGVDINSTIDASVYYSTGSRDYDYISGSPLHAACIGGQKEAALILIMFGADVRSPKTHTITNGPIPMTPINAAFNTSSGPGWNMERQRVHETCEIVLEAGACEDDGKKILEGCIFYAKDIIVTKHLLEFGVRGDRIAIQHDMKSASVDLIRLLLEYRIQGDPAELQQFAIEKGSTDLMRYLVTQHGRRIDMQEFMHTILYVFRYNHLDILRYLITEYGIDIDLVFGYQNHWSPLRRAMEELAVDSVRLLLELGANVQCPGLSDTALGLFRQHQSGRSPSMGSRELQIVRLLVSYTYARGTANGDLRRVLVEHLPSNMLNNAEATDDLDSKESNPTDLWRDTEDTRAAESSSFLPADIVTQFGQSTSLLPYVYKPLAGLRPIRLLELEPSISPRSLLKFRVIHTTLFESGDFVTLSYPRQDSEYTVRVQVEDGFQHVPVNVWAALRSIRLDDESRHVWVDMISINQNDIDEKSQQTRMLRDIYHSAAECIVYLGEEAEDSHLFFERIKAWHMTEQGLAAGELTPPRRIPTEKRGRRPKYQPIDGDLWYTDEMKERIKTAFGKLMGRPWFAQPWILVELQFCKKATAICGSDSEDFFSLFYLYKQSWKRQKDFHQNHPLRNIGAAEHWRNLHHMLDSHPYYMRVGEALGYTRVCSTTDPRDEVFSLMGLFHTPHVAIDYSLDVATVYRKFTQASIERKEELDMIHLYSAGPKRITGLASWVPDYSLSHSFRRLPRSASNILTTGSRQKRNILPGPVFEADDMLLQGKYLDKIWDVADEMPDGAFRLGDETGQTALSSWENLALRLTEKGLNPTEVIEAFLTTINANSSTDRNMTTSHFPVWYREYGTGVLYSADPLFFEEYSAVRAWIGEKDPGTFKKQENDTAHWFNFHVKKSSIGRRLFITESGTMGLAPLTAQAGDQIVYLAGGFYPFVLRKKEGVDDAYEMMGDCYLNGANESEILAEDGAERFFGYYRIR